jgi:hypothetical protein
MTSHVVRFALTKGEGCLPDPSDFSAAERADLRTILKAWIVYDPDCPQLESVRVTEVEFLYDGVTPLEPSLLDDLGMSSRCGYRLDADGGLQGYPSPIVRFTTDAPVDANLFRRAVWTSSVSVQTAAMRARGDEPYFAEDFNGYTQVLSEEAAEEIMEQLRAAGACRSDCVFSFPEGLPEGGHPFPATQFALVPQRKADDPAS